MSNSSTTDNVLSVRTYTSLIGLYRESTIFYASGKIQNDTIYIHIEQK